MNNSKAQGTCSMHVRYRHGRNNKNIKKHVLEYFVHSKFDLTLSGSWSYGCYGQINPYRNGRVSSKCGFWFIQSTYCNTVLS